MDEHKKFLAGRLLSEEQPITYRLLSRALDVHVNTAKCMLYDFHKHQNSLFSGSVHATYLLCGIKAAKTQQDKDESGMSSSIHEPEPLSERVSTETVALVREGDLQDSLREYQQVSSIHVYSLARRPQRDLFLLADVACSSANYSEDQGSEEQGCAPAGNKYGTIQNTYVRRRDGRACSAIPPADMSKSVKQEQIPPKPAPAAEPNKQQASDRSPSSLGENLGPTKGSGPGGIMQLFAKAASKSKQAVKGDDHSCLALSDDGEADGSDIPLPKRASTDAADARKSRKQREEELRRMMEEENDGDEPDDEEMEDAPEPQPESDQEGQTKSKEDTVPAEVISSTGAGRRRGKRRVMKKKRILDDQGYMVTIQEPGWESFSEDETPQLLAKKLTPTSTPSSSGTKSKKLVGKAGQGNIMSFFSKK